VIYNPNRLEWHLGEELVETPQSPVWSCRTASESFDQFNRLAVALAKSQDHRVLCGVFAFADRTPHEVGAASGAARKKTATRYAVRLGGSSRTIRAAGRIIKPRGIR
jgi:hypothetical protein